MRLSGLLLLFAAPAAANPWGNGCTDSSGNFNNPVNQALHVEGAEPKKACSDECIAHAEAVNATGCCSYQYVPYHTAAGAPKQSYLCLFYPGGSAAPLPAASAALSSRHSASMCG